MQENQYFTMQNERSFRSLEDQQLQKQVEFRYFNYIFPNNVQQCSQCNSFKTILEVPKSQIPEYYTKRLSLLNRSNYTIKLKQIKKEEALIHNNKIFSKLLLYYQAVPFSMEYAKQGPLTINFNPARLEKSLRTVINQLIQSNIYNELSIANCGFGEKNQFKVYVPPSFVLRDRKLTNPEKQAMINSAHLIVKYWQADLPKTMKTVVPQQKERRSTFSRQPPSPATLQKKDTISGEDTQRHRNSEEQTIDVKKTIKLSKNYVKQIHNRIQEEKQKKMGRIHELKKARSMQVLVNVEVEKGRKCSNLMSKINEINKKFMNIRDTFIRKKSATDHKIKFGPSNVQINANREVRNSQKMIQNDEEDIVFDKYQVVVPPQKPQIHLQKNVSPILQPQVLRQSIDTYLEQMGEDDELPRVKANCQMRKTTVPEHMLGGTQQINANWNHESAGNMMFKRFIQKNKDKYPEVFEQRAQTSISGVNVNKKIVPEATGERNKLKKMLSMDTFESKLETNSIHLSEYSNELSNVKKRKEKEERNRQIKKKVQDILIKSKKAIQMLRSPIRNSPM